MISRLYAVIKAAGGVTRDSVMIPRGDLMIPVMHMVAVHESTLLLKMLLREPPSVVDWNWCTPDDVSPLHACLASDHLSHQHQSVDEKGEALVLVTDMTIINKQNIKGYIKEERKRNTKRELKRKMKLNRKGNTLLARAVYHAYPKTLAALLRRLPELDLNVDVGHINPYSISVQDRRECFVLLNGAWMAMSDYNSKIQNHLSFFFKCLGESAIGLLIAKFTLNERENALGGILLSQSFKAQPSDTKMDKNNRNGQEEVIADFCRVL